MKRFGLIGYPIAGSLSPSLFEKAYGGRYPYDLLEEQSFEKAWSRFLESYDGINVTSPFKTLAASRSDVRSDVVERIGCANICVKRPDGKVCAFNSDYLAVKRLLALCQPERPRTVAVLGTGGAGRAALAAASDMGFDARACRHTELEGVNADVVISTLIRSCPGVESVRAGITIEANYHNPVFASRGGIYVGGLEWLRLQAEEGYALLTGEEPLK